MSLTGLTSVRPMVRQRPNGKLASTNFVNEVIQSMSAAFVFGQSAPQAGQSSSVAADFLRGTVNWTGDGTGGTGSASATWTYDLYDKDGNLIDGDMSPTFPRPIGPMLKAPEDSVCIYYLNAGGDAVLWFVGEVPDTGVCVP